MPDYRRLREEDPQQYPQLVQYPSDLPDTISSSNLALALPDTRALDNMPSQGSPDDVATDKSMYSSKYMPDRIYKTDDALKSPWEQISGGLGRVGSAIGEDLGSLGSSIGRGLNAITPSQDTLNSIGMRLQNMGAAYYGITPPYLQNAKIIDEMQHRRDLAAQHLYTLNETKRGHDLQLFEKAMTSPRASLLMKQLAQDPNYSMSKQAGQMSRVFKDADFASLKTRLKFLPPDIQQAFISGDLSDDDASAWADEMRAGAKAEAQARAKDVVLGEAMNTPEEQRTPRQSQLVEEHKAELELKKLKPQSEQAIITERQAKAEYDRVHANKLQWDMENGGDKLFGQDREALTQQLYGKGVRYGSLNPQQMKPVNDALLNFQGTQQLNKSIAVQQAQLQVLDKPSPKEREQMAQDLGAMDALDHLNGLYSRDFVGPVRGRAGEMMETFGGITEEEARFRASNATLKNNVIRLITGAQMSEPEAKRIMGQIPEPNNPPEVWEARLKETRSNIKNMAKKYRETLSQSGIDVSQIPIPGGKSKQPSPPSDEIQEVQVTKDGRKIGLTKSGKYVELK